MSATTYQTFGEWLFTPLDISKFSVATLDGILAETPQFHSMPKGCLIEGFIPATGYHGIPPTKERTRNALAYILKERETGKAIKEHFHSWASIIAYAGNELDFENIRSNLNVRTTQSLSALRESAYHNLSQLLNNPGSTRDANISSFYRWLQTQSEKADAHPEAANVVNYVNGTTKTLPSEHDLRKVAEELYPKFTDHCVIAAPDAAMLYAHANKDQPYKDLYAPALTDIQQLAAQKGESLKNLLKSGRKIPLPVGSWQNHSLKPRETSRWL